MPDGPDVAERMHGAAVNGVISRSVRDSAAVLDVLTGPDPAGPFLSARPEASYAELARRGPGTLRIGYATASPLGTAVSPDAIAAVDDAAGLLEALGHDVEPATSGVDERQLARDFFTMWFAQTAEQVDAARRDTGCGTAAFELDSLIMAALGRATSAPDHIASHNRGTSTPTAWRRSTSATTCCSHPRWPAAGPHRGPGDARAAAGGQPGAACRPRGRAAGEDEHPRLRRRRNLAPTPYTQLADITGRPAMSVPLHRTPAGLPLGVRFVGPPGSEGRMLALATQLESARPWADREPPIG